MLSAVCCLVLVRFLSSDDYCLLFVGCLLSLVSGLLFVVWRLLFLFVPCRLFVACCSSCVSFLFRVRFLFVVACYLLCVDCCLLFAVGCVLRVVYHLLVIASLLRVV